MLLQQHPASIRYSSPDTQRTYSLLTYADFNQRLNNKSFIDKMIECTGEWRSYFKTSRAQMQFLEKMVQQRLTTSTFFAQWPQTIENVRTQDIIHFAIGHLNRHETRLINLSWHSKASLIEERLNDHIQLQEELQKALQVVEKYKRNHLQLLTWLSN